MPTNQPAKHTPSPLFAEGYTPQDLRGHIAQIAGTYEAEQRDGRAQTVPHVLGQAARAFRDNSQLVSKTPLEEAAPDLLVELLALHAKVLKGARLTLGDLNGAEDAIRKATGKHYFELGT